MANTFNKYFISIVQDLARQLPSATPFIPPNPSDIPAFKFPVVTPQFVEKQLLSMPEKKAVGLDVLPGRLLSAAALFHISPSSLHFQSFSSIGQIYK